MDKHKQAMQYDQEGEWEKAHAIVQEMSDELACRIHAYLHRKEGDLSNANYWYQHIQVAPFDGDLDAERDDILNRLGKY